MLKYCQGTGGYQNLKPRNLRKMEKSLEGTEENLGINLVQLIKNHEKQIRNLLKILLRKQKVKYRETANITDLIAH